MLHGGSPYLPIIKDDGAEWLYRLPVAGSYKMPKIQPKTNFHRKSVFYLGAPNPIY